MLNPNAKPFKFDQKPKPTSLIQTYGLTPPPKLHYYPVTHYPFYYNRSTNYHVYPSYLPLLFSTPQFLHSSNIPLNSNTALKHSNTSFSVFSSNGVVGNRNIYSPHNTNRDYLGVSSTINFTRVNWYRGLMQQRETRRKTCVSGWRQTSSNVESLPCYDFNVAEGKTTVMVKNIPNKLRKGVLLEMLDKHCAHENANIQKQNQSAASSSTVLSEYDFVYLPMDFRSGFNLGYAFVNFTNATGAVRFYHSFYNLKWGDAFASICASSHKICDIKQARIQGEKDLVKHFKDSWFKCHTDEYLPCLFIPPRNGSSCTTSTVVGRRRRRRR